MDGSRALRSDARTVWIIGGEAVHLRIPLMNKLRERGFEMAAAGCDECPQFQEHGFQYFRYPLPRSFNPLADRRSEQELCRLFRRHRPQLVHAVNTKPAVLVPLAAKRAGGITCVRTITGLGSAFTAPSSLGRLLRTAYPFVQRRASAASEFTVFQNRDDRDYFLENHLVQPGRDELILSSGIDVDEFLKQRSDDATLAKLRQSLRVEGKVVVTLLSRLFKAKGVEEFLKAAAVVRQRYPETAFLLAGPIVTKGPMAASADWLERSAADVRYVGSRSDVADVLAISDLFVLPSYLREGVPRVLLEAGAMGLPLITTEMPGCRETVRDGWNGRLVPPRDWRALADAILGLVASQAERKAMGQRSQLLIRETFGLTKVADAYADIYRRALWAGSREQAALRAA